MSESTASANAEFDERSPDHPFAFLQRNAVLCVEKLPQRDWLSKGDHILKLDHCLARLLYKELCLGAECHEAIRGSWRAALEVFANAPRPNTYPYRLFYSSGDKRPSCGRLYGHRDTVRQRCGYHRHGAMVSYPRMLKDVMFLYGDGQKSYIDIDMQKGHPTIGLLLGLMLGLEMRAYKDYLVDFAETAKLLAEYYSVPGETPLTNDHVKDLFNLCLYGGGHARWVKDITEDDPKKPKPWRPLFKMRNMDKPHQRFLEFKRDTDLLCKRLQANNPSFQAHIAKARVDRNKSKHGRFMSFVFQTIEASLTELALKFLLENDCVEERCFDWAHDGVTFLPTKSVEDIDAILPALNAYVRTECGLPSCHFHGYEIGVTFVRKGFKPGPRADEMLARRRAMTDEDVRNYVMPARSIPTTRGVDQDPELPPHQVNFRDVIRQMVTEGEENEPEYSIIKRAYARAKPYFERAVCKVEDGNFRAIIQDTGEKELRMQNNSVRDSTRVATLGDFYISKTFSLSILRANFQDIALHYVVRNTEIDNEGNSREITMDKTASFLELWLKDDSARRIAKPYTKNWTYWNTEEKNVDLGAGANTWTPYPYDRLATSWDPTPEDIQNLIKVLRHMYYLSGKSIGVFQYNIRWFAHLIQYPGSPSCTALTFYGRPGCGKDTNTTFFFNMLMGKVVRESNPENVIGGFNDLLENAMLLVLDESEFDYSDKKLIAQMKSFLTNPTRTQRKLYTAAEQVSSNLHLIRNTNKETNIPLEKNDRRNVLIEASSETLEKDWIIRECDRESINERTLITMHYFLQRIDLSDYLPDKHRPRTRYHRSCEIVHTDPVEQYLMWLLEFVEGGMVDDGSEVCRPLFRDCFEMRTDRTDEPCKIKVEGGKFLIAPRVLYASYEKFREEEIVKDKREQNAIRNMGPKFNTFVTQPGKRSEKGPRNYTFYLKAMRSYFQPMMQRMEEDNGHANEEDVKQRPLVFDFRGQMPTSHEALQLLLNVEHEVTIDPYDEAPAITGAKRRHDDSVDDSDNDNDN